MSQTRFLSAVALFCFAVGLAFRLAVIPPGGGDTLENHYPIEDGYLTLTIAREMAIGHGMSTGEGRFPTNGTQPLFTGLASVVFFLVSGDKTRGVIGVLVLELAIALASAHVLMGLVRRWLGALPDADALSRVVACVWFAAPLVVQHSMNGLESGLYVLVALVTLRLMPNVDALDAWTTKRTLGVGAMLGLLFWARNDAVFFILAACLVLLFTGAKEERTRRFWRAVAMGATSVLVASPWLVANVVRFSHLMPISGVSEGLDARFGENLGVILVAFVEHAFVALPIPLSFEDSRLVQAACGGLGVAVLVGGRAITASLPNATRPFVRLVSIYGACLVAFFGLWFGAAHFASRYVFPLSPYLTLFAVLAIHEGVKRLPPRLAPLLPLAFLVLGLANTARAYLRSDENEHETQVRWVRENVPSHVWIAAVQTGTLGFYHDRTINLDGKVNAEALDARIDDRIHAYTASCGAEYIIDWYGLRSWMVHAPMSRAFAIHVEDPDANLTVLRRLEGVETGPP